MAFDLENVVQQFPHPLPIIASRLRERETLSAKCETLFEFNVAALALVAAKLSVAALNLAEEGLLSLGDVESLLEQGWDRGGDGKKLWLIRQLLRELEVDDLESRTVPGCGVSRDVLRSTHRAVKWHEKILQIRNTDTHSHALTADKTARQRYPVLIEFFEKLVVEIDWLAGPSQRIYALKRVEFNGRLGNFHSRLAVFTGLPGFLRRGGRGLVSLDALRMDASWPFQIIERAETHWVVPLFPFLVLPSEAEAPLILNSLKRLPDGTLDADYRDYLTSETRRSNDLDVARSDLCISFGKCMLPIEAKLQKNLPIVDLADAQRTLEARARSEGLENHETWVGEFAYQRVRYIQNAVEMLFCLDTRKEKGIGLEVYSGFGETQLGYTWFDICDVKREGASLSYVKRYHYDPLHRVSYEGVIEDSGDVIQGSWRIHLTHGTFVLRRQKTTSQEISIHEDLRSDRPSILLTYFGPFHNRPENASEQLVRSRESWLRQTLGDRVEPHLLQLPVVWGLPGQFLRRRIEQLRPIGVLMFGEHPDEQFLLEQRAHARRGSQHDEAGRLGETGIRPEGADECYDTLLDVDRIASGDARIGTSSDAGGFLCEEAYYHGMHWSTRLLDDGPVPVLFVHVPRSILEAPAEEAHEVFAHIIRCFMEQVADQRAGEA